MLIREGLRGLSSNFFEVFKFKTGLVFHLLCVHYSFIGQSFGSYILTHQIYMFDALKSSEHPRLIYVDFDSTLNPTGFLIDTDNLVHLSIRSTSRSLCEQEHCQ
jgi:hypothetical protein